MRNAACFLGSHRNQKCGGPRRRLAVAMWQRWHTCHLANAYDRNLSLGVDCGDRMWLAGLGQQGPQRTTHGDLSSDSVGRGNASNLISL